MLLPAMQLVVPLRGCVAFRKIHSASAKPGRLETAVKKLKIQIRFFPFTSR